MVVRLGYEGWVGRRYFWDCDETMTGVKWLILCLSDCLHGSQCVAYAPSRPLGPPDRGLGVRSLLEFVEEHRKTSSPLAPCLVQISYDTPTGSDGSWLSSDFDPPVGDPSTGVVFSDTPLLHGRTGFHPHLPRQPRRVLPTVDVGTHPPVSGVCYY